MNYEKIKKELLELDLENIEESRNKLNEISDILLLTAKAINELADDIKYDKKALGYNITNFSFNKKIFYTNIFDIILRTIFIIYVIFHILNN
jgi:hypothetical protein